MASSIYPLLVLLFFSSTLTKIQGSGGVLLLEYGYTVSTILDGNKLHINPHSILPQFGSSDLIILDMSSSTFYTLSFPNPQGKISRTRIFGKNAAVPPKICLGKAISEKVIKKLAGNGLAGYVDGELGTAMFNKPNSFAVDLKGNLFVADKFNHTIRKISKSGVTTIAGGYSEKAGKKDGPAQNASFSDEFELVFIPDRCALMISDYGNKLIRQINLKPEDCSRSSQSVMGAAFAWTLGSWTVLYTWLNYWLHDSSLCSHMGRTDTSTFCNKTWKRCLINLARRVRILFLDIKSGVVSSTLYAFLRSLMFFRLCTSSLMFRIKTVEPQTSCKKPLSLLDCDDLKNNEGANAQVNQLMDLISFDEGLVSSTGASKNIEHENIDVSTASNDKVDSLMQASIVGFVEHAKKTSMSKPLQCSMGLVKRRWK